MHAFMPIDNSKKGGWGQPALVYNGPMHKGRMIVILGAVVALIPLSGLPGKNVLEVIAGLSIIGVSVWSQIDKKLSLKAKAQMRQMRKVAEPSGESAPGAPIVPAPTPTYGKRVTDFYPKTGQPGRRRTDLGATIPSPVPEAKPPVTSEEEPLI